MNPHMRKHLHIFPPHIRYLLLVLYALVNKSLSVIPDYFVYNGKKDDEQCQPTRHR